RAGWLFAVGVVACLSAPGAPVSGGELPGFVVVAQAQVDEALQVDRGAAVGEADLVAGDPAVADFAAAAAHEPGDGSFDHWAVPLVGLDELGSAGAGSGSGHQSVMFVDLDGASAGGGGATLTQRTAAALGPEGRRAGAADPGRDTVRAGRGAGGGVDREVVDREPAHHGWLERDRFDRRRVTLRSQIRP